MRRDEVAARIREQAGLMRDQVNYYLDRARAAALAGTLGTLTDVEPVIAGLARTFAKIYRDKELAIELDVPPGRASGASGRISRRWPGNLIDNAAKWATRKVLVAGRASRGDAERPSACVCSSRMTGPGCPRGAGRDAEAGPPP